MRSRSPSVSALSPIGLSSFRRLFLRGRGCPIANGAKTCADLNSSGRDVEGEGDRPREDPCTKETPSVAIGFFSSRHLRRSRGRNLERRSSRRIAHNPDGSGNGADSREVDFDDQEPGCQEALGWIFARPPPFAAYDERLALMTQAPRRFRVDMLKGE